MLLPRLKKGSLLVFHTDVEPNALNLVMSYEGKEIKEILEN